MHFYFYTINTKLNMFYLDQNNIFNACFLLVDKNRKNILYVLSLDCRKYIESRAFSSFVFNYTYRPRVLFTLKPSSFHFKLEKKILI